MFFLRKIRVRVQVFVLNDEEKNRLFKPLILKGTI